MRSSQASPSLTWRPQSGRRPSRHARAPGQRPAQPAGLAVRRRSSARRQEPALAITNQPKERLASCPCGKEKRTAPGSEQSARQATSPASGKDAVRTGSAGRPEPEVPQASIGTSTSSSGAYC
ncbi:hypothetical protein SL003B_3822 [Polymorphum gilvum SL003B-26A1]|uniref:Uncharacterized protein n=1 Tax=Polymorphum gilvum (strain LMG 25793 / CGMCC 1.9160 / SL003B-26A1) TaxID=991905 RepID=F2J4J0_POLGS|nr:hypothetical protein SL003B_3822 [Polymorphum gilvum SL003B-26A1]